ncbi:unnamed protein product [Tilletia controversa]|nr:unnamed protein product [Tilletia controversa]
MAHPSPADSAHSQQSPSSLSAAPQQQQQHYSIYHRSSISTLHSHAASTPPPRPTVPLRPQSSSSSIHSTHTLGPQRHLPLSHSSSFTHDLPPRSTSSKRPLNASISGPLSAFQPTSPTRDPSAAIPRVPVRAASSSIDATALLQNSHISSSVVPPPPPPSASSSNLTPVPERKNTSDRGTRPSSSGGTSRSATSRNPSNAAETASASAIAAATIAAVAAERLSSSRHQQQQQQRHPSLSAESQLSEATDAGRASADSKSGARPQAHLDALSEGTMGRTANPVNTAEPGTPLNTPSVGPTYAASSTLTVTAGPAAGATGTGTATGTATATRANGGGTSTTGSAPRAPRARQPAPARYVSPLLPSAPNMTHAPPPAMYWSRAPMHGNIPRRSFKAHTACLADEVLWIFGGCDASSCFRDLFCFDTETMCWSRPRVEGEIPPARRAHSATMVDRRLFVFAGGDGPAYYNDVWVFDTVALRWSKPEVYGTAPSPRRAHTSSYWDQQLIIFGGGNGIGALNDVFSLDLRDLDRLEWKRWSCFGKKPIGRGYHTSNLVDGKLIVIGGSDGHTSFGDIHILKLDTKFWYHVTTEEQHLRMGHTATQVGSYLFVTGGHDGASYTSEILTLNLVNLQWEPRRVCGRKPPGRGYHEAWLRDSRLFMHGGYDGRQIYDDLHYVDLAACAYLPQITSFGIELEEEEEDELEDGEGAAVDGQEGDQGDDDDPVEE